MRNRYLIRILYGVLRFAISVLLLSVLVFTVSRAAPGDPLYAYYGEQVEKMSAQQQERAREKLGLGEPIPVQYMGYGVLEFYRIPQRWMA